MAATARCVFVVLFVVAVVLVAAPAAAEPAEGYRPPVDAPVRDPYRAPPSPYAAGNRGIEYDTAAGTPVVAPAAGTVAFAGVVAGARWVAIDHPDGLRSTVGPM